MKSTFGSGLKSLSEFIKNSITLVADYLGIKTEIVKSSSLYINKDLKAQSRVIDICKREGADEYINLPGGEGLYRKEDFKKENINLRFIKSDDISYNRQDNLFLPNLSIIDVIMNCNKETIEDYLSKFSLYE